VFFDDLRRIREGVDIEMREVSRDTDLPVPFSRVATDETIDYMKRFDKGIELLTDIKTNTDILTDVKNDLTSIKSDTSVLGDIKSSTNLLVEGQNRMLEAQNKVVTLLQKIESKFK
jgi:hypothetical protein